MGRYQRLQDSIFAIFASPEWAATGYTIYPQDFVNVNKDITQFLRLSILASNKGINRNSISGVCIIEIFVPFGQGPSLATMIGDTLDTFLTGENSKVQFGTSTMVTRGQDTGNPQLTKYEYTIPVNLYGDT
jgi:hypothetical protein